MTDKTRKILTQSLIGVFIVIVLVIVLIIIFKKYIPEAIDSYFTPYGNQIVIGSIFSISLCFWIITKYETSSLFLTSVLIALFILLIPCILSGPEGIILPLIIIYELIEYGDSDRLRELLKAWLSTGFPVFCAAIVLFFLRRVLRKVSGSRKSKE